MARCVTLRSYRSLKATVAQLKIFPFRVSTTIEVKSITTCNNTGTLVIQHTPRYRALLSYILIIQSDQKVSVHLTITVQSSGAQRLFDYPVFNKMRGIS